MEKKLKCKMSTFQTDLTYNEWAEQFNVSGAYVEPTPYYTGNSKDYHLFADAMANKKRDPIAWTIGQSLEKFINKIRVPF